MLRLPDHEKDLAYWARQIIAFDDRTWKHSQGVETVRHAVHHFLRSVKPVIDKVHRDGKSMSGEDYRHVAGVSFELIVRLEWDGLKRLDVDACADHISHDLTEDGFRRRAHAIGVVLDSRAFMAHYTHLVSSSFVAFEDGEEVDVLQRNVALGQFVDFILDGGMRAARLWLASTRDGNAHLDTTQSDRVREAWCACIKKRYEYLEGKRRRGVLPAVSRPGGASRSKRFDVV